MRDCVCEREKEKCIAMREKMRQIIYDRVVCRWSMDVYVRAAIINSECKMKQRERDSPMLIIHSDDDDDQNKRDRTRWLWVNEDIKSILFLGKSWPTLEPGSSTNFFVELLLYSDWMLQVIRQVLANQRRPFFQNSIVMLL